MHDASAVNGNPPPTEPQSMYVKTEKIYSRKVKGTWRTVKTWSLWTLLGIFYITPWLRWDRGEGQADQAVLLDIDGRRGYILNMEFWPQEVYYLTGLLVLAAVGLFFSTALFGRVWCGFACFQTVFTDLYIMVERWVEGERNARIKLDKAGWSASKLGKRVVKHTIWMLIAFTVAYTFVLYFNDSFRMTKELIDLTAGPWVLGTVGGLTFTTYLFAGLAREQVCIYMCPYARFQAAMMDEQTMVVTYEELRGEPRGKARPTDDFDSRGHCVDCEMCVQACPTGTDIRQGQQMSCIGCNLCVDACATVMKRFKLPPNLITYDSEVNLVKRAKGQKVESHLLRPRTLIYSAILLAVTAVMGFSLTTRSVMEVNIIRDRAPLFVRLSDGGIKNGYTFKILNMVQEAKTFGFEVEGIENATFAVIGYAEGGTTVTDLPAKPGAIGKYRVLVKSPKPLSEKSVDITFKLTDRATGEVSRHRSVFMGPGR